MAKGFCLAMRVCELQETYLNQSLVDTEVKKFRDLIYGPSTGDYDSRTPRGSRSTSDICIKDDGEVRSRQVKVERSQIEKDLIMIVGILKKKRDV